MIKKILIIVIIFINSLLAQRIGDITSPYSTSGWDTPYGYTTYFGLPLYRLLSNPGGWINISQRMSDSLFNALIVLTDTDELEIVNDTLYVSTDSWGRSAYSGTNTSKVVSVAGMKTSDAVIIQIEGSTITTDDISAVTVGTDEFTVTRIGAGTSDLPFIWKWIKRH